MCRAAMYGGMEETYGIRVLYPGLESRLYMGLSSCQFLLFSPTVSAYEDLHVSTSTGEQGQPFWLKPFWLKHCSCVQGQVVWFSFVFGETTRYGSQACMAVHGRAFGVGANLARSTPSFSPVAQSGCAAQTSATCISGNSIRAPMGNSCEVCPSAESSINVPRISKSPDEVRKCAFSKVARLQAFGRRRSEEIIFAAGSQTCPVTDCSSTCRPTHRRLHAVHRACEEAGPDCGSGREESSGGTEPPTRRARRCRATSGRPPARSCKGRGCSFHNSTSTSNDSGGLQANWRSPSRVGFKNSEVAHRGRKFKARVNQPVRDSVEAAQIVRAAAEKRRAGWKTPQTNRI